MGKGVVIVASKLLKRILADAAEMDPSTEPEHDEIAENEKPLFRLNNVGLRKMWLLSGAYTEKANEIHAAALQMNKECGEEASRKKYEGEYCNLLLMIQITEDVFWTELRIEYDLVQVGRIGIRKGWQIVNSEATSSRKGCGGPDVTMVRIADGINLVFMGAPGASEVTTVPTANAG